MKKILYMVALIITNSYSSAAFPGITINTNNKEMKLIGDEHFYWYETQDSLLRYNKNTKKYEDIMVTESGELKEDFLNRSAAFKNTDKIEVMRKATKKDLYRLWKNKRYMNHAIIK